MYTFDSTSRTNKISTAYTVDIFLRYEFIDGELVNIEHDGLYIAGTSGNIEIAVEENKPDWY